MIKTEISFGKYDDFAIRCQSDVVECPLDLVEFYGNIFDGSTIIFTGYVYNCKYHRIDTTPQHTRLIREFPMYKVAEQAIRFEVYKETPHMSYYNLECELRMVKDKYPDSDLYIEVRVLNPPHRDITAGEFYQGKHLWAREADDMLDDLWVNSLQDKVLDDRMWDLDFSYKINLITHDNLAEGL